MHTLRRDTVKPSPANVMPRQTGSTDQRGVRFVLSQDWKVEHEHEAHVTVVNIASGKRLKLSLSMYEFILRFCSPSSVEMATPSNDFERILSRIPSLLEYGLLIGADAPLTITPKLRTSTAYRFCNAPSYERNAPGDYVILGVPYDLGGELECRTAPSLIRQKSLDYPYWMRFESRQPQGWHDVNSGERILEGAVLADGGDVHIEYGESQHDLFVRIRDALEDTCGQGTIPVLLGGDRSITYAAADYLQRSAPLVVLQFAAHPATSSVTENCPVLTQTVGRQIAQLQNVVQFVSVGGVEEGEGIVSLSKGSDIKRISELRHSELDCLIRQLPANVNVHLSIDVGMTIPEYTLSADKSVMGLSLAHLKELIRKVGASHRIIGVDIVGLDTRSEWAAVMSISACHLALTSMDAAWRRMS